MKVRDLIKVLQGLDPEDSITLSLGRDDEYRTQCAKAELGDGECLAYLNIDRIEIYAGESSGVWADIVLQQFNIGDLDAAAEEFDEQYVKKDEQIKNEE